MGLIQLDLSDLLSELLSRQLQDSGLFFLYRLKKILLIRQGLYQQSGQKHDRIKKQQDLCDDSGTVHASVLHLF